MNDLLTGLLGALVATNSPQAVSNFVRQATGVSVEIVERSDDPVEREFQKLMAEDDTAQAEIDAWIKQVQGMEEADIQAVTLRARVRQRVDGLKKSYEIFFARHPKHGRARIAYGSLLNDLGEEDAARTQWEKARELEPNNPAVWNNLANYYGHNSPVTNAFACYQKAIELNPNEAVYYENFATTVYLFRHDATNYFKISSGEVFDKAMGLYRKALALDPENFILAQQYAQSYYGFKPPPAETPEATKQVELKHFTDALAAWRTAFVLARDDIEREGVYLHFARWQISAGQFAAAQTNLNCVTNVMYASTKTNLMKKLVRQRDTSREPVPVPAAPR